MCTGGLLDTSQIYWPTSFSEAETFELNLHCLLWILWFTQCYEKCGWCCWRQKTESFIIDHHNFASSNILTGVIDNSPPGEHHGSQSINTTLQSVTKVGFNLNSRILLRKVWDRVDYWNMKHLSLVSNIFISALHSYTGLFQLTFSLLKLNLQHKENVTFKQFL